MNEWDMLLHVYAPQECGKDGYPRVWHTHVKYLIRDLAGHRCERCGHPYPLDIAKTYRRGEWTPCDDLCTHELDVPTEVTNYPVALGERVGGYAHWRILTVHHLNGYKWDLRWWNLAALCQKCHLQIQGKVKMHQTYPWEHSEWFKPHAAGLYASVYLGEELTREQTMERLDELLALELVK